MTDKNDQKHIKVKGILEYIENKNVKHRLHGIVNSEGSFYRYKGELVPAWIVEAAYPDTLLKNRRLQDDSLDGRAIN